MTDVISEGSEFPDNIDSYPAGPELDAILAERVLGARIGRYKEWTGYENVVATDPNGAQFYIEISPHFALAPVPLWNPSINLSDAQALVRYLYMHSEYRSITEEGTGEGGYSATLWAHRPLDPAVTGVRPEDGRQWVEIYSVTGSGPTPALAVCRAVYKAASDIRPLQVDNG